MAADILVPALGESVTSATIARWLKQPGEAVTADEPLVELETDKVTVEVNAPAAGTMGALEVPEGAEVEVGTVLGRIEDGAGAAPAPKPAAPAAPAEKAPTPQAAPKATSTEAGVHTPPAAPWSTVTAGGPARRGGHDDARAPALGRQDHAGAPRGTGRPGCRQRQGWPRDQRRRAGIPGAPGTGGRARSGCTCAARTGWRARSG